MKKTETTKRQSSRKTNTKSKKQSPLQRQDGPLFAERDEPMGELIDGGFALSNEPTDYQITVHITNFLAAYPGGAKIWKTALMKNPKGAAQGLYGQVPSNMINYYGLEKMQQWFHAFYGWEFEGMSTTKKTRKRA